MAKLRNRKVEASLKKLFDKGRKKREVILDDLVPERASRKLVNLSMNLGMDIGDTSSGESRSGSESGSKSKESASKENAISHEGKGKGWKSGVASLDFFSLLA